MKLKILTVLYIILFIVNLGFVMADREPYEVADHCYFTGNLGGIVSSPVNYYLYRERGRYYLTRSNPRSGSLPYSKPVELTREQYIRCIPSQKDLDNPPPVAMSGCGYPHVDIEIKYPGRKAITYESGNNINAGRYLSGISHVVSEIEDKNDTASSRICNAVYKVFEEYGVKGATFSCFIGKDRSGMSYRGFYTPEERESELAAAKAINDRFRNKRYNRMSLVNMIMTTKDHIIIYFMPSQSVNMTVNIMSDDLIARPGLILALARSVITFGRLGVIPGERTYCHAIFIAGIQNIIFGLVYCLLSVRKWYNNLHAKRVQKKDRKQVA